MTSTSRQLLAITNAQAGSADDVVEAQVIGVLRTGAQVEVAATSGADDLARALAAHPDLDAVVVLGGDGSLHAVVQALHDADRLDVLVALVPLGTGNDFARTVELPDDPVAAARVVLEGSPRTLDLALTGGKLKNSGTRNGQAFVDQNIGGSSMLARLSFSKLGAFTPYVGLSRTMGKFDAFTETGTGANLNVSAATQTNTNAEVGLGYAMKLTDTVSISLNVAYEHNLNSTGNSLTASFADAAAPTSFNVATYGAGQNVLRGGIGFEASLGAGRSAGLSYDMHSGVDMKSAHEVKVNYTFRF